MVAKYLLFKRRNRSRLNRNEPPRIILDIRPRQYYALNEYLYQLLLFLADGEKVRVNYYYDLDFESFRNLFVNPRPQQDLFAALLDLESVQFSQHLPGNLQDIILLHDKNTSLTDKAWKKSACIEFDSLAGLNAMKSPQPTDAFLPYPMFLKFYPLQQHKRLPQFRANSRPVRALFAGGEGEAYRANGKPIFEADPMLDRCQVLRVVDSLPTEHKIEFSTLEAFTDLESASKFVRLKGLRIDEGKWLDTLSLTNFFLCPPGVSMPMCHNIIEALAVGTIPITNYPNSFPVPLEHGVNCLSFKTEDELKEAIVAALSMDSTEVKRMREAAAIYYDTHCSIHAFHKTLEALPTHGATLYVNSERVIPQA